MPWARMNEAVGLVGKAVGLVVMHSAFVIRHWPWARMNEAADPPVGGPAGIPEKNP